MAMWEFSRVFVRDYVCDGVSAGDVPGPARGETPRAGVTRGLMVLMRTGGCDETA